jgi:hypothetical protein
VRGTVGYGGQARENEDDFDGVRVEGEQRQFYHPRGMVIVDVVCVPSLSGCDEKARLLDTTEAAVLGNLTATRIDALLPETSRCEVQHQIMAGSLATCEYANGLFLTMQQLSVDDTRQAMRGLAGSAQGARR